MAEQPPSSIDSFLNQVQDGGSRPNQFQVMIPVPTVLQNLYGNSANISETVSFLSKSSSLPASNVGSLNIYYRGRPIRLPGDRDFSPWSITIINASHFSLRRFFEDWSELVSGRDSIQSSRATEVMVDAKVKQLDRNGQTVSTYNMVRAWPSTVSEIPLSYDAKDVVEEFQVTFQYQYWMRDDEYPELAQPAEKKPSQVAEVGFKSDIIGTKPDNLAKVNFADTVARQAQNLAGSAGF